MTVTAKRPAARSVPLPAGDDMSRRQRVTLVLVLGTLMAIGPLTIDMYLPALPAIQDDLLTTSAAVQLTLTGTLVGMALGQLVIGPLSDAFGRRRPLVAGLAMHVVASALCVVAPNIAVLGVLRLVQGLGVAAAVVTAMAVVRDLFTGRAAAVVFSRLMLVMGVAPVVAPLLGGEVLRFTGWRGVFTALVVLAAALLVLAAVRLPETLPEVRRTASGVRSSLAAYRRLLRDPVLVGLALVTGLAMASLFAYIAGSTFVFQETYGLSEQEFGLAFAAGSVGLIAATQGNVRLLRCFSPQQVTLAAVTTGALGGVLLIVVAAAEVGGLVGLLLPLWLVLGAVGLVIPNTPALALSRHGDAAGSAAALLGAAQFGLGGLAAPLVGVLGNDALAMAVVMVGVLVLALLVLVVVVRPWRLVEDGADVPVRA